VKTCSFQELGWHVKCIVPLSESISYHYEKLAENRMVYSDYWQFLFGGMIAWNFFQDPSSGSLLPWTFQPSSPTEQALVNNCFPLDISYYVTSAEFLFFEICWLKLAYSVFSGLIFFCQPIFLNTFGLLSSHVIHVTYKLIFFVFACACWQMLSITIDAWYPMTIQCFF